MYSSELEEWCGICCGGGELNKGKGRLGGGVEREKERERSGITSLRELPA
jgi:hypothetical protein